MSGDSLVALVADDDPAARATLRSVLEGLGVEVWEANDGWRALQILHGSRRPDLVITELNLPALSGAELCELVRADPLMRSVPVLVHSASTTPQDRVAASERGASAFVAKPATPEELTAAIRALLPRPRAAANRKRGR